MRFIILGTVLFLLSTPAHAGCNSPVAAVDTVDDYGVPLLVDVLANDRDADGDALTVEVTGTTCAGHVVTLRGNLLEIDSQGPQSCTISYRITDTTGKTATSQVQLTAVALGPLFADGFELGSTVAWSETCPGSC